MSATRDQSQKATFVYSNLYQLYRKGKDAATGPESAVAGSPPAAVETPDEFVRPFGAIPKGVSTGQVLKAQDLSAASDPVADIRSEAGAPAPVIEEVPMSAPEVRPYTPIELLGKRVTKPASLTLATSVVAPSSSPMNAQSNAAIESLKENLKNLNDLHSRLRFMLRELEDLVKE
jgi:hypothetical protein